MIIKQIVINAFFCGIICTVALILSGNGPLREPVRICCVCLMTAAVFSFFSKGFGRIDTGISRYDLEQELNKGIKSSETEIDEIAGAKLNKEIENRMKKDKINCFVKTLFDEHEVVSITLVCAEADRGSVKNILVEEYGFDEGIIIWRGNEN